MKFCQSHWGRLHQSIKDKGMWHLVSKDGHELKKRYENGEKDVLMEAHNMIISNALRYGGIDIMMGLNENGEEYCPLCEAAKNGDPKNHTPNDVIWIEYATDHQLEYCIKNKLLYAGNS